MVNLWFNSQYSIGVVPGLLLAHWPTCFRLAQPTGTGYSAGWKIPPRVRTLTNHPPPQKGPKKIFPSLVEKCFKMDLLGFEKTGHFVTVKAQKKSVGFVGQKTCQNMALCNSVPRNARRAQSLRSWWVPKWWLVEGDNKTKPEKLGCLLKVVPSLKLTARP